MKLFNEKFSTKTRVPKKKNNSQDSNFVSLQELKTIFINLENDLELKTIYPEKGEIFTQYFCLNKTLHITPVCSIVKNTQSDFSFHTDVNNLNSPQIISTRKKILHTIQTILIEKLQTRQYIYFRDIIAENLTCIVEKIIKKKHKDFLFASQFINMLAYLNSTKGFPLLVNCFPDICYQSYYNVLEHADYTYAADDVSQEKKRKRKLKYSIRGYEADKDKSFIAAPANLIQAFDATILRKVAAQFLKEFPNKGLWLRHDCFGVPPECVSTLQKFYKQAFIDTFFTNSQDFTYKDQKILLAKKSPIYIFQMLVISNIFNLLDYSIESKGYILESSNIFESINQNKEGLRKNNDLIKKGIMSFVKEPDLDKLCEITTYTDETIFTVQDENAKKRVVNFKKDLADQKTKLLNKQKNLKEKSIKNLQEKNRKIKTVIKKLINQINEIKTSESSLNKKELNKISELNKKIIKQEQNLDQNKTKIDQQLNRNFEEENKDKDIEQVVIKKAQKKQRNSLERRYNKLKKLADLHQYKDKNQLEVLLILYLIIFETIEASDLNYEEILYQSNPLS